MRVDLPSGHWAELRDNLLRGDVRFARKAMKITIDRDDARTVDLSFEDEVTGALLYRMIVGWDIGQTLPRNAQTLELAQGILDMLDDQDYKALAKAVRPMYLKVMERPADDEDTPKGAFDGTGTSSSAALESPGPAIPSSTDIST
jgi:hypothetical protein